MGLPRRHAHEDIKLDIAAVGRAMVRAAGEVADGIHVHPFHSRALPARAAAAGARAEGTARRPGGPSATST